MDEIRNFKGISYLRQYRRENQQKPASKAIMNLEILNDDLLEAYIKAVNSVGLKERFEALKDAEISTKNFRFYTSVASVFSSKIEGEEIELDSYIKHKGMGIQFNPDYTKKIDDLYDAYEFARKNDLTASTIVQAHKLLAKNIVASQYLGQLRNSNMYVASADGRIEFVAVDPYNLKGEMTKFYKDVSTLTKQVLSVEEIFYYAAFIHLVFVKIHPWNDGNGRSARLIEKWFVSQHLGEKAWFLESEKNYYTHHNLYYHNLRLLGLEYIEMDYGKALPFLLMLPQGLK